MSIICQSCKKACPKEKSFICVYCQNAFCSKCKRNMEISQKCNICKRVFMDLNTDIQPNRKYIENEILPE